MGKTFFFKTKKLSNVCNWRGWFTKTIWPERLALFSFYTHIFVRHTIHFLKGIARKDNSFDKWTFVWPFIDLGYKKNISHSAECGLQYAVQLCCLMHHPTHNAHTIIIMIIIITNPKKEKTRKSRWMAIVLSFIIHALFLSSSVLSHIQSLLTVSFERMKTLGILQRSMHFLCDTKIGFQSEAREEKCKWKHFLFEFSMCFTMKRFWFEMWYDFICLRQASNFE